MPWDESLTFSGPQILPLKMKIWDMMISMVPVGRKRLDQGLDGGGSRPPSLLTVNDEVLRERE